MKSKTPHLKTVLFSILSITLLFFLFLPFICDTYLLPRLIGKLPFSQKELSLSRISPWKIRGTLRLSQDSNLVASVPKFELHYSPFDLLRGELDTLLIDGATIQLEFNNNKITYAGSGEGTTPKVKQKSASPLSLPVIINKIVIRDSHLRIQDDTGNKDLIVDALILLNGLKVNGKYNLSSITGKIDTSGAVNLTSSTSVDFGPTEIRLTTEVNVPNLTNLSQFGPIDQAMFPTGSLAVTSDIRLQPETSALNHFNFIGHLDNVRGSFNDISIHQTQATIPIQLSIEGNENNASYSLNNVSIETAGTGIDCSSTGTVQLSSKTFGLNTNLYSQQLQHPFTVKGSGSYEAQVFAVDWLLDSNTFAIDQTTTIGPLQLQGRISYNNDLLESKLTGNIAEVQMSSHQLRAEDISWDLFFQFPQQSDLKVQQSRLNIGTLHYKNERVASLTTHFTQEEDGISHNTDLISKTQIETSVHCTGFTKYSGTTTADCTLPATSIESYQLPDFVSIPEGTSFSGNINGSAKVKIDKTIPTGRLKFQLTNGTLSSGETHVTDVETIITFPHLPFIQSEPGQLATIGSIDSGKIHLEGGKIVYRIENEQQLFLEKVRLSWCGGKVETGSLTLNSKMDNLEATLYCDRLGFAPLLQQFGIEDTEGQGSLNGRLPVSINQKGISFDDGFLFSTPGNSGIVRFTNTDQLQQGLPDIGQSATLDYSIKSLENFAYNWTKLTFKTEDDNLLLALQLDGKPAEPLPFGYKNGQIVATEKGPGLQHPVRLDMNFRLPLQELFQYGKSLQSIMENM